MGENHPYPHLADRASRTPDADALMFPHQDRRLSYRDWLDDAGRVAAGLLRRGLHPGDRVALLAENRPEWPTVQLGLAMAGMIVVPVNTHFREDELHFVLEHSRADAIVLSGSFRSRDYLEMVCAVRPRLPDLKAVVVLDHSVDREISYGELVSGQGLKEPASRCRASDPAAILYTSGTTGRPKGAVLTHGAMMTSARSTATRLGLAPTDRVTSNIPLFHCSGCVSAVLGALTAGCAYVGVPAFEPASMMRIICDCRATVFFTVPTALLAMAEHPDRHLFDLSGLRAVPVGATTTDPRLLRRWSDELGVAGVLQAYGLTEAATLVTCASPDDPDRFETAGAPVDAVEVRICDPDTGAEVARGTEGEVQVCGPTLMSGYLDDAAATEEALIEGKWLRTGDIGALRSDGKLVLSGSRIKDIVIRGGENVYPAEVEAVLHRHPDILEACVFGLPDPRYGEIVAAALRSSRGLDGASIAAHCADLLARYKIPVLAYAVEVFPLTASGKIKRAEVRAAALSGQLGSPTDLARATAADPLPKTRS